PQIGNVDREGSRGGHGDQLQTIRAQGAGFRRSNHKTQLSYSDRVIRRQERSERIVAPMGQKTNPVGLRVGVNKDWRSKWYSDKKEFGRLLSEDRRIRELLKRKLESASVPRILIERAATRCRITILTARPGVVIGR